MRKIVCLFLIFVQPVYGVSVNCSFPEPTKIVLTDENSSSYGFDLELNPRRDSACNNLSVSLPFEYIGHNLQYAEMKIIFSSNIDEITDSSVLPLNIIEVEEERFIYSLLCSNPNTTYELNVSYGSLCPNYVFISRWN